MPNRTRDFSSESAQLITDGVRAWKHGRGSQGPRDKQDRSAKYRGENCGKGH